MIYLVQHGHRGPYKIGTAHRIRGEWFERHPDVVRAFRAVLHAGADRARRLLTAPARLTLAEAKRVRGAVQVLHAEFRSDAAVAEATGLGTITLFRVRTGAAAAAAADALRALGREP
jgi:hypothetical protein